VTFFIYLTDNKSFPQIFIYGIVFVQLLHYI